MVAIELEPFERIPRAARLALDEEAAGLAAFYEPLEPRLFARYRTNGARGPLPQP